MKRVVIILGMHRSGTSVLSASLECLGVEFGNRLIGPRDDNPKGFWEDREFVELNDRLYAVLGANSSSLGFDEEDLLRSTECIRLQEQIGQLLEERLSEYPVFGIKDPRMPRLMNVWWRVLESRGLDCSFVVPLRNPLSVAASLAERDGFAACKSLLLWYEHMFRVLMFVCTKHTVVVDYDHFLECPRTALMRIGERLGLDLDESSFTRFSSQVLDDGLRHSRFDELALQGHANTFHALSELYALLRELANDRLSLETEAFLRRRSEVEKAFVAIWPLLRHCGQQDLQLWELWQSNNAEREWFSEAQAGLMGRVEELEGSIMAKEMAWQEERNRLQDEYARLRRELQDQRCVARGMEQQLRVAMTGLETLHRSLQEQQMEIGSAREACAAARRRVDSLLASSSWRITAPLRGIRRLFGSERHEGRN
ncbi:sulfotransferase family protein [Pseudomonas schmalbachii]|uniref:Sulfotransferase family protein n=1 Tax=Pseudomonas schmalbachii TaxID=2816993 RepID=A0ABS3TLN7_9PSED|nr:hypothetical protein [Pseudomonas schmalbachii]MBO3274580.1 hypothetical protein [Pseudomonas schmalbachii]